MSGKLRLNGATSGYSELQAPDVAGDQTFTLPATGGELATKSDGGGQVVGYQQGLWTPNPGVGTLSFVADRCIWTRSGNWVSIWGYCTQIASNSQANTSYAITGVPYEPVSNAVIGSCMVSKCGKEAHAVYINSSKEILFYKSTSGTWDKLDYIDINSAGNDGAVFFSGSFITSDTTWVPQSGATIT